MNMELISALFMVHTLQITNTVKANILENICKRFEVIRKYIPESNARTFMGHVTHVLTPSLASSYSQK